MFGFHFCKVTGVSMSPTIPENSYVFVVPWLKIVNLKEGALLKVFHPRYGYIVKSLAKVDRNGLFWLKGHHKSSVPIENLGPVGKAQIQGKVLWIFPPKS
jgi:nickel-type superoxide dismutase maturation protease